MGLLAEKQSRSRISRDPNNTKWTRDTKTFGQKILRSQGWEPGQFLGAQDAAHSELHTAANASYIRVALKDDMKGLGYNKAKEDEVTGLDVFSDLLSRLNGKSEESVEGDRQARLVVKTNRYVEAKWGPMRFIRGGLLVGDEMQAETESDESTPASDAEEEKPKKSKKDKKSKKRKAEELEAAESESSSVDTEKKEKRRRKEERRAKKLAAAMETENNTPDEEERLKKKSKKEKSRSKTSSEGDDESVEVKKSKKDKKEKKEKKDKKKRNKDEAETADSDSATATAPASVATSAPATGTSTPTGTGTSTPRGSRNFVRSRFIAQKKQAVLDTKALAQIFMVKT
ncbi:G-patch RNA maturation protein [Pochonia chlamydosporia 170]|uniref:PinX1-related protein 1 n=1 Tax=Pochonia chlamydosporia 170 TaxID=1380566 RepID=A0A179G4H9_METCM|nr:G-patch RNA maturation protein [Pochonia chlamydosporia 170]OAQ72762.1 G-patch RNA maturation protein [Pochonia chlamydosporia 170]